MNLEIVVVLIVLNAAKYALCRMVNVTDPYMEGQEITYDLYYGGDEKTWADARENCSLQQKHLLVFNSPYMRDFLLEQLQDAGLTAMHIWTALIKSSGSWGWDAAEAREYWWSLWKGGSPTSTAAHSCALLTPPDHDHAFVLNNVDCDVTRPYICTDVLPNDYNPCRNGRNAYASNTAESEVHPGFTCTCTADERGDACEHNVALCGPHAVFEPESHTPNEELCFWRGNPDTDFHSAYAYCLDHGGYLANIPDGDTETYLNNNLAAPAEYYTGASAAHTRFVYRWSTGHVVTNTQVLEVFKDDLIDIGDHYAIKVKDNMLEKKDQGHSMPFFCQSYNPNLLLYKCEEWQDCLGARSEIWTFERRCLDDTNVNDFDQIENEHFVYSQHRCKEICERRSDFKCRGYQYRPAPQFTCKHFSVGLEDAGAWSECDNSVTQFRDDAKTFRNNECYVATQAMSYDAGKTECESQHSGLSIMYSAQQLEALRQLRVEQNPDDTLFIGLKYNPSYFSVQNPDGTFPEWSTDWELPDESNLCFYIHTDNSLKKTACTDEDRRVACQGNLTALCLDVLAAISPSTFTAVLDTDTFTFMLTCNDGHEFSANQRTRLWPCDCSTTEASFDTLQCDIVQCTEDPANLTNSEWEATVPANYGTVAAYMCDTCHYFSQHCATVHTATCTSDGTWSDVPDTCVPYPEGCCGELPALGHGQWLTNYSGCGGQAIPVCDEGWTLPDCARIELLSCNCSTNWTTPLLQECIEIDCGDPTDVYPNGLTQVPPDASSGGNGTTTYGAQAVYECNPGYGFESGGWRVNVTCGIDGNWTELTQLCQAVSCESLAVIDYADSDTANVSLGTEVTFTCRAGHLFSSGLNNVTTTCVGQSGEVRAAWQPVITGTQYSCQPQTCPPAADSMGNASRISPAMDAAINSSATYQCDYPGHRFSDGLESRNVTCLAQLGIPAVIWSQLNDICTAAFCMSPPPQLSNVANVTMSSPSSPPALGDTAMYTCWPTYRFSDLARAKNVTCELVNDEAVWSVLNDSCMEAYCTEAPPAVHNATVHNTTADPARVGDRVNYTCHPGHVFSSCVEEEVSYCTEDLTWTPLDCTCTLVDCAEPDKVNTLPDYSLYPDTTYYGSTATLRCFESHYLDDQHTIDVYNITCQLDGQWSTVNGTCTHICGVTLPLYNGLTTTISGHVNQHMEFSFTCKPGHVFADDRATPLRVTCDPNTQSWEPEVTECIPQPTTEGAAETTPPANPTTDSKTTPLDADAHVTTTRDSNTEMSSIADDDVITPSSVTEAMPWEIPIMVEEIPQEQPEISWESPIMGEDIHKGLPDQSGDVTFAPSLEDQSGDVTFAPPLEAGIYERCEGEIYTEHARRMEFYDMIGGFATYECEEGYSLRQYNTASSLCLPSGQWHVSKIICQPKMCNVLSLSNADCPVLETMAGHVVECTCQGDHVFYTGLPTMPFSCLYDQTWFPDPRDVNGCIEGCRPPPLLPDSRLVLAFSGREAAFRCDPGHRFHDTGLQEKTVACGQDGIWEDPGICKINICPQLDMPANGSLTALTAVYQGVVMATCDPGFTFQPRINQIQLECLEDGTWNGTIEDCEVVRCGEPGRVANADVSDPGGRLYMDIVTYTCAEGARLGSGGNDVQRTLSGYQAETIYCEQTGEWSSYPLDCEFGRCRPVPEVTHAQPDSTNASDGTVVTYTCEEGYMFENGFTASTVCSDTVWHPASLQTDVLSCDWLPNYSNARLTTSERVYLTEAHLFCDPGYTLGSTPADDHMVLQCGADAQWHVTDPDPAWNHTRQCLPVVCEELPHIPLSIPPLSFTNTYRSLVTYTCARGYWLTRDVYHYTVTCGADALWGPAPPAGTECTRITCVAFPAWDGMILNTTAILAGTAVNATCAEGYTFPDEGADTKVTNCNSTGHWHPPINDCVPEPEPPFKPQPVEVADGAVYGAIGVTMVSLIVTAVVLADIQLAWTAFTAWQAAKVLEVPAPM